jgi:hypothetical protein
MWRILFEGVVNPVCMMVVHIIADQPAEMLFIERDHMVQDLPAATAVAYPAQV